MGGCGYHLCTAMDLDIGWDLLGAFHVLSLAPNSGIGLIWGTIRKACTVEQKLEAYLS